jgi:hypothetical protein
MSVADVEQSALGIPRGGMTRLGSRTIQPASDTSSCGRFPDAWVGRAPRILGFGQDVERCYWVTYHGLGRFIQRRVNAENRPETIELLKKELKLAGVNLKRFLPSWGRVPAIRDGILQELLITLDAPLHEGLIPPYGSIILNEFAEVDTHQLEEKDLEIARKAADGSSALVAFRETGFVGLHFLDPLSVPELELAQLTEKHDAVVIRRDRSSVVTVFARNGSLRHAGRRWTIAPSIFAAVDRTKLVAPMLDWTRLFQLLEFAYYVLSPWHIGSTLIWLLSDDDPFSNGTDLQSLALTLNPAPNGPSLAFAAHLLAQYDGATIISPDGRILRTGVHLNATQKAHEIVRPLPGLRHTSAKRASFDYPATLVVTVSSDGPVTIFSDGMSVFELRWYSADAAAQVTRRVVGARNRDLVMTSGTVSTCANCGKTSDVEILTIAGYRDHEEASCPVCDNVIASDHLPQIHANLRKVF